MPGLCQVICQTFLVQLVQPRTAVATITLAKELTSHLRAQWARTVGAALLGRHNLGTIREREPCSSAPTVQGSRFTIDASVSGYIMEGSYYKEAAASLAARAFFWPSLMWNVTRERLDSSWHWCDLITEVSNPEPFPKPGSVA